MPCICSLHRSLRVNEIRENILEEKEVESKDITILPLGSEGREKNNV